jgi:hypothetical protein
MAPRKSNNWTTWCLGVPPGAEGGGGRTWKGMDGLDAAARATTAEKSGALTGGSTSATVTSTPCWRKTLASWIIGVRWPTPRPGYRTTLFFIARRRAKDLCCCDCNVRNNSDRALWIEVD